MAQVATPIPPAATETKKVIIVPIPSKGTTSSVTPQVIPSTDPSTDSSDPNAQQIRALIYELMEMLQIALGQISKINAETQTDQTDISSAISKSVNTKTQEYEKKYQEMLDEIAKAHSGFMGFMSDVFGNSIASTIIMAIIGALLVETGVGAVMLAGTIALKASGAMDKMTDGLAGVLEKAGLSDNWAHFLAGTLITVALTGGTGMAEGVELNVVRAGSTAGENIAANAAENGVANVAEKEAASASENAASQSASDAGKAGSQAAAKDADKAAGDAGKAGSQAAAKDADKTADEAAAKDADGAAKKPSGLRKYYHGGFATAQVFTTTLFATNPVFSLVKACGGSDEVAMWVSLVVNILAALASLKCAMSGKSFTSLTQMMKAVSPKLETGVYTFQALCSAGQSGYNAGNGIIQMNTADIYKQIGPITQALTILKAMTTVNNSLFSLSQKNLKDTMASFQTAFSIDFSLDWKAAAQATVEIAG